MLSRDLDLTQEAIVCYNRQTGHGQMLRVVGRWELDGPNFLTVSCRENPEIGLYGVETADTGDSMDRNETQENQGFPANPMKTRGGRSSVG